MLSFTAHHFNLPGQPPPPVDEQLLYDYLVGGNGTFVRGRRPGLEVCIPIALYPVKGLKPITPYVQWGYPKISAHALKRMIDASRAVCNSHAKEALFHLCWNRPPMPYEKSRNSTVIAGTLPWWIEWPRQYATANSVVPLNSGAGTSTDRALIELHSHHVMKAEFSDADDRDEAQGFRVYAVIGTIFDRPTIRVRVGCFGFFMEYPASEFFELPEGITDVF